MKFVEHTLPNGLEIVAELNDDAHSTAVGFFVQTGARDETDDVSGVSHFLEHMAFKGTPTRTAEDVNREFDEIGAHYNAFTSEENTVYYASVLPEHQSDAVDLLGDIVRPSLRDDDFNTEKQVIIEEIRMYEDQPPFGADEKAKAEHFLKHPLGRSVLGTVESIQNLSVDAMRAYFRRRYVPSNIKVVGAGRIDFDLLIRDAERLAGEWEPLAAERACEAAAAHSSFRCLTKESATLEYVMQLANAPSATAEDRFAAKLLGAILGDDSGSRLYWELVDPGKAEQATLSHYDYQDVGLFMTYLSCVPQNAEENLKAVLRVYRDAETNGLTATELAQAKSKINSRIVLSSERPRGRLFTVGGNWLQRREYRSVADDIAAIDAVTLEQVTSVLRRFPLSTNTTMAIGPLASLRDPASAK